jgi:hypothetical protein
MVRRQFKAFTGCDTESQYKARIVELRQIGVKPVSVNTWYRCINAYLNWKFNHLCYNHCMRLMILLAAGTITALYGQTSSEFLTGGEMANGRMWQTFPESAKNVFVGAVHNELRFDLVDDHAEFDKRWAKGLYGGRLC